MSVLVAIVLAALALYWQRKTDADSPADVTAAGGLRSSAATGMAVAPARDTGTPNGALFPAVQPPSGDATAISPFPGESPDHGPKNHWGMISDDGTTLQLGPVASTLSDDERYRAAMQYLSKNLDSEVQITMANAVATEIGPRSSDVGIQEMACDGKVCMGTLFIASEDAVRKLARSIGDNRDRYGIYTVTLQTDVSQTNLSRFLLVTDPIVRRTIVRGGPGFRSPETPQLTPELRKALEQAFEGHAPASASR